MSAYPPHRPRPAHRQAARCVPALRRPQPHPPRHAQEKTGDRATLALRILQAHLHARPGRAPQQDLSAAHDPLGAHRLQPRLLAGRDRRAPARRRRNRSVSPSTITAWLDEYKQHCTYRRFAPTASARFPANQTIRSIKLYHRQVYGYAYHRPKLEFVRTGTLDDKRPGDTRFAALADFLESIPTTCPHELFRRDDDPEGSRIASHAQHSRMRLASSSTARRTRRRRRPRSSSRPSATTSCVTRRCSGSCSPTTA